MSFPDHLLQKCTYLSLFNFLEKTLKIEITLFQNQEVRVARLPLPRLSFKNSVFYPRGMCVALTNF
jgi:hypothetical protein